MTRKRISPRNLHFGALAAAICGVDYNTGRPTSQSPRHRFEVYGPINPATGRREFLGTLSRSSRDRGEATSAAENKFGAGVTVFEKGA